MILLDHLHKTYRAAGREAHALVDVSLEVPAGEVFGIIGRSGAGKSTLIRMLNLLERPTRGRVVVNGDDITAYSEDRLRQFRQRVGMVFQHFNLLRSRTVLDNVCFPLKLAGVPRAQRVQRAHEVLQLVGLADFAHRYPRQLSGGQQQRVGIARALANKPDLLLCDEATSALDPETTQSILRLLLDINQSLGLTIVLITHGMDVIRSVCDRVAVIDAGRIVESGPVIDVFLHPQHAVTQSLLAESGDQSDAWQEAVSGLHGAVLRLSFRDDTIARPVLSRHCRELGLDFSLLQARVGRIKHTPYGQLVVLLEGAQAGVVQQLRERLKADGVDTEELRA